MNSKEPDMLTMAAEEKLVRDVGGDRREGKGKGRLCRG